MVDAKQPNQHYPGPKSTLVLAILLPCFAIIAVFLRFYTRRKQAIKLQTDDWVTLPALLMVIGLGAILITGERVGVLGHPTPGIGGDNNMALFNDALSTAAKYQFAFYLISVPALGLTKLSFLFFYKRIFCVGTNTILIVFMWTSIGVIITWTLGYFFTWLTACGTNIDAWWGSLAELRASCIDTYSLLYGLSLSDLITDAIILIIPLPLIFRLQLSLARKLIVAAIFMLGVITVGCSAARFHFVTLAGDSSDPFRDVILLITQTLWWGLLEVGLGLIAACLPTLRYLMKGYSPESIVNSVRSALSLRSLGSGGSRGSSKSRGFGPSGSKSNASTGLPKTSGSQVSHDPILNGGGLNESNVDAYPLKSISSEEEEPDQIRVHKDYNVQHGRKEDV